MSVCWPLITPDRKTTEAPGPLCSAAFVQGVRNGRNGLGSIFVFAAGNGGGKDNCNFDGYTNSIYTISIGALGRDNAAPYYQEPCAAQMAVAYSSNTVNRIVRVALRHGGVGTQRGGIVTTLAACVQAFAWRFIRPPPTLMAAVLENTAARLPQRRLHRACWRWH